MNLKKSLSLFLSCLLILTLAVSACIAESNSALAVNLIQITGKVTEIEKYGHTLLDTTIDDFNNAGFTLGDIVTVTAGSYSGDMPYFDGYYTDNGEYMVRAYPDHNNIAVCINYGKFSEAANVNIGDIVSIALKEKGGALTMQQVSSLVYTNERSDYTSDEIFANFREISTGDVAPGILYRSASPINNENKRASTANKLAEAFGIKSVMNMGDTAEEIITYSTAEDFDSAYYKAKYDNGNVIALGMPVNFTSDEFATGIVKGLTFLSEHEGPYLIHCTEGKDRAGFTSMLLAALMGATQEEIITDYMISYVNYYNLDPQADAEKYNMIAEKHLMEMLRMIAGLDKGASLDKVDFSNAAEAYLTSHGMASEAIEALKENLK